MTELFLLVHDWQLFTQHRRPVHPRPHPGLQHRRDTRLGVRRPLRRERRPAGLRSSWLAPPGTVNIDRNQPSRATESTISRGLLMVSELVTGERRSSPTSRAPTLTFVDAQRRTGADVADAGRSGGRPAGPQVPDRPDRRHRRSRRLRTSGTSWTYSAGPEVIKTTTLARAAARDPAGQRDPERAGRPGRRPPRHLEANASTPGQSKTGGHYTWSSNVSTTSGDVVDTFNPTGTCVGFQPSLRRAWRLPAKVTFTLDGSRGRLGFGPGRVRRSSGPPPRPPSAHWSNPRSRTTGSSTGSLSLDLRMTAEHPVRHLRRRRRLGRRRAGQQGRRALQRPVRAAGTNTCDTGPLLAPGPGEPPTTRTGRDHRPSRFLTPRTSCLTCTVTITNSYGETITRVFPITGEHRPKYDVHDAVRRDAGRHGLRRSTWCGSTPPRFPARPRPRGSSGCRSSRSSPGILEDLPAGVSPGSSPRGQRRVVADQLQRQAHRRRHRPSTLLLPLRAEHRRRQRPSAGARAGDRSRWCRARYRLPRHHPWRAAARSPTASTGRTTPTGRCRLRRSSRPGRSEFTDFTGTRDVQAARAGPNVVFDKPCTTNAPVPLAQPRRSAGCSAPASTSTRPTHRPPRTRRTRSA